MSNPNLRFAAKKDKNHNHIKEGFQQAGYDTYDTHKQGEGFPDLLVLSRSHIPVLFEIKQYGERLTNSERVFHRSYTGPLHVISTLDEGIMWITYYDDQRIDLPA